MRLTHRGRARRNDLARRADGPAAGQARDGGLGGDGRLHRSRGRDPRPDRAAADGAVVVAGVEGGGRAARDVGDARSGRGGGRHGAGAAARVDGAAVRLDALPGAGAVAVSVRRTGRVVARLDGLDDHVVGPAAVVGGAAGPLHGARGVGRVAAAPDAQLQLHGRLRVLALLGALRREGAHCGAVDLPHNLVGGPVDRVGVEVVLVAGVRVEGTAVVGGGLTLAEVVALHLLVVGAEPLEVDFVEVVGLHDHGADDADARRGLHHHLDVPEHEVPVGREGGRVAGLGHGQMRAVGVVTGATTGGELLRLRGEVYADGVA